MNEDREKDDVESAAAPQSASIVSVRPQERGLHLGAIIGGVVALDLITKLIVQRTFHLYEQREVIGDYLRLTFIYNPGAAFGIHVGEYSRVVFFTLSLVALIALVWMYWTTPHHDRMRLSSIALICAGALGNLIDRVRSPRGVVDFLDVGIGDMRWPVFNVADMAVTIGAVLLAISLWNEDTKPREDGGLRG
ncbi:MAG TPA: signal peptidase II [Longimicrobiales bacterium]